MNDHNLQFFLLSTTREHMYLLHDNSEVFLIHSNIRVRKATDHIRHYVVDGITLQNRNTGIVNKLFFNNLS